MNMPPNINGLPPIEQLRDFHTPEAVPVSPADASNLTEFVTLFWINLSQAPMELAFGWWLAMALVFAVLISIGLMINMIRQRSRYRRVALKELKALYAVCDDDEFIRASARLLKRVVVHHVDQHAAVEHGTQWQQRLISLHPKMPEPMAFAIAIGQYQADFTLDKHQLFPTLKQWLRGHRAAA